MDQNNKIDRLNALRQLQSVTLPLKKVPEDLQEQLNDEFKAWVANQIDITLGAATVPGAPAAQQFSEQEVAVLKAMVEQVHTRANRPRTPQPPNKGPAPQNSAPLKEAVDTDKFLKVQKDLLSELDKMDKQGQDY